MNSKPQNTFEKKLKTLLKERKIAQKKVAENINVSEQVFSNHFKRKNSPPWKIVEDIVYYLKKEIKDFDVNYLFDENDKFPTRNKKIEIVDKQFNKITKLSEKHFDFFLKMVNNFAFPKLIEKMHHYYENDFYNHEQISYEEILATEYFLRNKHNAIVVKYLIIVLQCFFPENHWIHNHYNYTKSAITETDYADLRKALVEEKENLEQREVSENK